MLITSDRWKHFTAMALIGDGVMAVVRPRRDVSLWAAGPVPWRKLMKTLDRHPLLTRFLGGAEAAAAIFWVLKHPGNED